MARRPSTGVALLAIPASLLLLVLLLHDGARLRPSPPPQQRLGSSLLRKTVVVDLERQLRDSHPLVNNCSRWVDLGVALSRCVQNKLRRLLPSTVWAGLAQTVSCCGADLLRTALHTKYLVNKYVAPVYPLPALGEFRYIYKNTGTLDSLREAKFRKRMLKELSQFQDDVKAIILPRNENASCTVVTAGIGGDIYAEKRLKDYVPKAQFYGADPILDSGYLYKRLGDYHQIGISVRQGQLNASVLVNGKYQWQMVEAIGLQAFLDRLNLTFVDYLLLDVEGAEYDILPQLMADYEQRKNLTICQINAELHGPLSNYGADNHTFWRTVQSMTTQMPFLPLWVPKPTTHHRIFLVDWKTPACVEKYFGDWCA